MSAAPRSRAPRRRTPVHTFVRALVYAALGASMLPLPLDAQARTPRPRATRRLPVGWRVGMNVASLSESNARFQETGGPGDVQARVGAELAGSLNSERSSVELRVSGDMLRYREQRDLDRVNYDVGLRAGTTFSPRFKLDVEARTRDESSLDRTPAEATEDVLLLPFTRSRTNLVSSTAALRLSPTADATAEVSWQETLFDTPGIVGGSIVNGRFTAARRYSSTSSIGLLGEASFISNAERSIDLATLSTQWGRLDGPLQLALRAGLSMVHTSDSPNTPVVPVGEAMVRRSARGVGYELRYARGALQTFGLGRALTSDQVTVSHDRVLWSSVLVRLSGDHSWIEDPTSRGVRLRAATITGEARREVASGVWVSAGGFVRRRTQDVTIEARGILVSAGFTRTR